MATGTPSHCYGTEVPEFNALSAAVPRFAFFPFFLHSNVQRGNNRHAASERTLRLSELLLRLF